MSEHQAETVERQITHNLDMDWDFTSICPRQHNTAQDVSATQ